MILVTLTLSFNLAPLDSMSALMKIMQIFTNAAVRKSYAFGIFLISALPHSGSQYSGPFHNTWKVEVYPIILGLVLTVVSQAR